MRVLTQRKMLRLIAKVSNRFPSRREEKPQGNREELKNKRKKDPRKRGGEKWPVLSKPPKNLHGERKLQRGTRGGREVRRKARTRNKSLVQNY